MALTIHGYRILKSENSNAIKTILTVKPYIPSCFIKPQYVNSYKIYRESNEHLYVPKHYGIEKFGIPPVTTRNIDKTDKKYWEFSGTIRPNQIPVVDSFLKPEPHDGIISLQTGGGKTVCGLYIASQLQYPTLILVHNTFLKDQWIDRIKAFLPKARIGSVQGDTIDIEQKDIIVCMLQSLSMKEYPLDTFKKIGLVIVDECHHIASEAFSQSIPKITSKYMLGLSATPERKDKLMYVINWFLGPLLYQSNTEDKIDAKVKVEYFEFDPPDKTFNDIIYNSSNVMFTSLMINKVVEYQPRNEFLIEILKDVYQEKDRQILVLSDRVEHTKTLFNLLPPDLQENTGILGRDVKSNERAILCSTKKILIATYSMCKEGFDVQSLNTLLIATSRPDVDQIVGRIMRVEKEKRKIHPLILDVVDPAFRRQFQERLQLYKKRSYQVEKTSLSD
jgi:superfamily II DNA or RNA helicase